MVNNSCVTLGSALLILRLCTVDVVLRKCVKVVNGRDINTSCWVVFVKINHSNVKITHNNEIAQIITAL